MTIELAYSDEGARGGMPLLLGSSLGTTRAMWDEQMPALTVGHRVVRFDHRGHGASPVASEPSDISDLGGDVIALLDRLVAVGLVWLIAGAVVWKKRRDETVERLSAIVESSGEVVFDEGCLSIVGLRLEIVRPETVTVRGLDLDGNEQIVEADDFFARMLQHEIDHLDGVLMLDRLDPDARKAALRELRRRDELAAAPVGGGNPFGR